MMFSTVLIFVLHLFPKAVQSILYIIIYVSVIINVYDKQRTKLKP